MTVFISTKSAVIRVMIIVIIRNQKSSLSVDRRKYKVYIIRSIK